MRFDWNMIYTVGKMFSKAKKYCPYTLETNLI
jgi:hypothetical protein